MEEMKKIFRFCKGRLDFDTWIKVSDFVFEYFTKKRRNKFKPVTLKTNYKITIIIEKGEKGVKENK